MCDLTSMWCGVVWCGVVWCGVVVCLQPAPDTMVCLCGPPAFVAALVTAAAELGHDAHCIHKL